MLRVKRESFYKKAYGITVAEYETKLAAQGGVCALCGHPPKKRRLDVDHNHKTKRVRGLLCYNCNRNMVCKHTIQTARALVEYLEHYDNTPV